MTDVTRCPDPDALLVLLYEDEGEPAERAALEAHVAGCHACASVLTSLGTARGALGAWHAPRLPLGFALVRTDPASRTRSLFWGAGMAAAAVLVLSAASGLARLQITFDQAGLSIRTGVTQVDTSAATRPSASAPAGTPASTSAGLATQAGWVTAAAKGEPPWRADFDLLASQLRSDMARYADDIRAQAPPAAPVAARVAFVPAASSPTRSMSDEELLRRVQDLLDQSEVRQQQNLALRVTELGRQFELQRQADIVQVEQTLNRIEQQRRDLLRRVSSTQPQP